MTELDNADKFMLSAKCRLELASPGPWDVNSNSYPVCNLGNSNEDGNDYEVCMNGHAVRDGFGHSDAKTDAEFIAHSRHDMELLIKACRLMKTELAFQAQPFIGNNGIDFDYTARAMRMQEKAWECLEKVNQICREIK